MGATAIGSEGFRLDAEAPAAQILPKPFAEIAAQSMLATSHLLWSAVWFGVANNALARAQNFRPRPGKGPAQCDAARGAARRGSRQHAATHARQHARWSSPLRSCTSGQ